MNLLEYQGKHLFSEYGIPVPKGRLSDDPALLGEIAYPAVVKAQVPIGGRGKAGGIRTVDNPVELLEATESIGKMSIGGFRVNEVLVEQCIKAERELYLSIAVDRSRRMPLLIASGKGGMEIESVPECEILRQWIDPWVGVQPFMMRSLALSLGLQGDSAKSLANTISSLWRLFQGMDAELVEINPLVVQSDGSLVAVDSKVVLDDDALYRHGEIQENPMDITTIERKARERGISFVQLDGEIGVIANGAGLTMATLDFLTMHGGRGDVFLDLGGTDDPEMVKEALLLMAEAAPKVVLINIFGGITKCDTVAKGLIQALEGGRLDLPIIARIKGVNEAEAVDLLRKSEIRAALSLDEATRMAVELASDGGE